MRYPKEVSMEIKCVNDFLERCFALKKRNDGKDADKERVLFFRGENTLYEKLLPLIYRPNFRIDDEHTVFKEIVATFPDEMLAKKTTIEKLILMQHYELPTRILDMSKNPLVGLFFACYEDPPGKEKDGRVYVFSVPEKEIKFCDSDSVCLVANICKRPTFSIKNIRHLTRDDFNKEDEITYLVHDARQDKPELKNLVEPYTLESVICLHPLMNNERIRRQNGYFFLYGIDGDKKTPAKMNKDWIVEKITIPGNIKKPILKELDFLNINESSLYADYRHLSNGIQARYKNTQI
jgi:hypothetical protein